jgi:hypothetical protein
MGVRVVGLKLGWIVLGWSLLLLAVSLALAAEASQASALESDVPSSVARVDAANLAAICAGSAAKAGSESRAVPGLAEVWPVPSAEDAECGAGGRGLIGAAPAKADKLPAFAVAVMPNGAAGFDRGSWSDAPTPPAVAGSADAEMFDASAAGVPAATSGSSVAAATGAFGSPIASTCCDEAIPAVAESRPAAGPLGLGTLSATEVADTCPGSPTGPVDVGDGAATIDWIPGMAATSPAATGLAAAFALSGSLDFLVELSFTGAVGSGDPACESLEAIGL